jgi:hypothetical protein
MPVAENNHTASDSSGPNSTVTQDGRVTASIVYQMHHMQGCSLKNKSADAV